MNVRTAVAVVMVCGLATLAGCASMKSKDSSALVSPNDDTDWAYVSETNKVAELQNVRVVWVNPPSKPKQHTDQN